MINYSLPLPSQFKSSSCYESVLPHLPQSICDIIFKNEKKKGGHHSFLPFLHPIPPIYPMSLSILPSKNSLLSTSLNYISSLPSSIQVR